MNITDRFNLLFNKNECIKVIITDVNKRVKTKIIRIKGDKMFNVGKRTYVIDLDKVFFTNGLPTYFYYIENPDSISKQAIKKSLQPANTYEASIIDITSSDLNTAVEETITKKIIRYAEDGDKKIINTIFMMGGINILATLGGSYFVFMTVEKVLNFLLENELLIEAIKDFLINSTGQ